MQVDCAACGSKYHITLDHVEHVRLVRKLVSGIGVRSWCCRCKAPAPICCSDLGSLNTLTTSAPITPLNPRCVRCCEKHAYLIPEAEKIGLEPGGKAHTAAPVPMPTPTLGRIVLLPVCLRNVDGSERLEERPAIVTRVNGPDDVALNVFPSDGDNFTELLIPRAKPSTSGEMEKGRYRWPPRI